MIGEENTASMNGKERQTSGWVDFHTHILPDMDDGSESLEESLVMLRLSAEQGVGAVVLTPHFYATRDNPKHFLAKRANRYNLLLRNKTQDLPKLVPGAEIAYFEGIGEMAELDAMCIGKSRAILVEMPFYTWTERMMEDLFDLTYRKGYRVILAHIERYRNYCTDEMLERLIGEGILLQSNASFFVDRLTRRRALRMLGDGKIHFLGTDCHNLSYRPPNIREAIAIIQKKHGEEAAESIRSRSLGLLLGERIPIR